VLNALLAAVLTGGLTFAILRAAEWLYHRWRATPDWSPHWGTWVFAALVALGVFVNELGR